jgi:hypothetical protein
MVKSFNAWCNPKPEDFILTVLSDFIRSFSNPTSLILLSKDEKFKKSLRFTKSHFDHLYKNIESNTKFSFE